MSLLARRETNPSPEQNDDDDIVAVDIVRLLVVLFIVWQIMCVALWLMPASTVKAPFVPWIQPYMWVTGCDQNWNMFSPNPASQDVYLVADITYQNGAQETWTFPRMYELNYFQRYQEERFRKLIEYAHQDNYRNTWPYLARFAALANNKEPQTNPVVHVDLVRYWRNIPNPGVPLPPYTQYLFYKADFAPGSLDK